MVSVWKKTLARFLHSRTGVLAVAVVCALVAVTVFSTTSMAVVPELDQKSETSGVILANYGDESSLAGKLSADQVPVTLIENEVGKVVMANEGSTVAEVLQAAGILMGPNDTVTPSAKTKVKEFDEIVVKHCEERAYTIQHEIGYKTLYYYSDDVRPYEEKVAVQGSNGVQIDTFKEILYRGEVEDEVLADSKVVTPVVDEVIHIGFKTPPVSSMDFGWAFDDNREPVEYKMVIRGGKATGYSAPSGAGTASGRPAMVGHVAVDPSVIPYGSKLYIQSSDGNFVYGYAIAADTGSAMRSGRVDIDLFYATHEESMRNGLRSVDIFVLE